MVKASIELTEETRLLTSLVLEQDILPEKESFPAFMFQAPGIARTAGFLDVEAMRFELRCLPTSQMRPRHMRLKNGRDITYKAKQQKNNEAVLEEQLMLHIPPKPMSGALELSIRAIFPVPKSAGKKTREAMLCGKIGHTSRPDADNLAKQIKDAMTRLNFWHDDRQVAALHCIKTYGSRPCWQIALRKLAESSS